MAKHDPQWNLYRSFLAVMSEGSLSAAARQLDMTQPSLGRHIRDLEAALGVDLFTRSPQGLVPTDMAYALLPHAQAMAAASAALRRASTAQDGKTRGVVRVTASEIISVEVLPAMLTAFRKAQPEVVIELSVSNQSEDLLRKDADIAVRMARPTQQALVTRHIGRIELGAYAHKRYLRTHGRPATVDALRGHSLIGFDHETPYVRSLRPKDLPFTRELFALRTDNDLAALAAIRAGYGIGFCQVPLAAREPQLVRLLPEKLAPGMDTWVVMHEDMRRHLAVRKLFDHLATALIEYANGR